MSSSASASLDSTPAADETLDEIDRRRIEEDLIRGLKPRMNDMEIPQAVTAKPKRRAAAARAFSLSALLGGRPQGA